MQNSKFKIQNAEVWKPVVGWEGLYEVSDFGRVRSLPRRGTIGKILKPYSDCEDRQRVDMYRDAIKSYKKVHKLVLESFVGPCPNGKEGAHNDGNSGNNRLNNLRWTTHANNMADKLTHGTVARGEGNGQHKLKEREVIQIFQSSTSQAATARIFGVCQSHVSAIKLGKTWSWLTGVQNQERMAA